jgi:hypothetical protein
MQYQYGAQRFRTLPDGRRVGVIGVGTIIYLQDGVRPFRFPERVTLREPWQVMAWIPRESPRANRRTSRIEMQRCAGGHLAIVRSLRTSRQKLVADWILRSCVDAGLEKL